MPIELPYASEVIAEQHPAPPNTWALCAGLVTPQSRGTVRLASAHPAKRPVVDMKLLSHPWDVAALRIADSTIMPRIVAVPVMPACVLIGLRRAELLSEARRSN